MVKKEEPNLVNIPIKQNSNNSNSIENILNNINFSNNNELNVNEIANAYKRVQPKDIFSFYENADLDKIDDYFKLMGMKFSDIFGIEPHIFKILLKVPSFRNHFNTEMNMIKDPSLLEMFLKHPGNQDQIKNNPVFKLTLQNPQLMLDPQNLQMNNNLFKKNESNPDENSKAKIFKPPEPFGSLNNNQINQMKNSSHQIPNSLNSNNNAFNLNNINFSNNNKINTNEVANAFSQLDYLSIIDNVDIDKFNNVCKAMGMKSSDSFGEDIKECKELLKVPSFKNKVNSLINLTKDPSLFEMFLKDPEYQTSIKNNPFLKLGFLNPQLMANPQFLQMGLNIFKKNESNQIENSISKNLVPPDPFGNLNNSQINEVMKPSDLK